MTQTRAIAQRRAFATLAMVGVVIYVVVDVVLQMLPPYYDPIREAESNLAVGPFGWIMSINFFGRAILCACAILAIARVGESTRARRVGIALFAVAGFCSGALAFFPTDIHPDGGVATSTTSGAIHLGLASTGFVVALVAFGVLTQWLRGIRSLASTARAALVALTVAGGGLIALAISIAFFPGVLGLMERICLAGILAWVFVVANGIRRLR